MAHAQNNVSKVYKHVMDEVIKNVRESFLNDGVDEQVLQELKQIWESKVTQSKAVEVAEARTLSYTPQVLLSQVPPTDSSQHQLNVVRRHTQVTQQVPVRPAIASSTTPVTVNQQSQKYITAATQPQYIQQAQYTQVMVPGTGVSMMPQQMTQVSQANQQPSRPAYHGLSVPAIQPTHHTIRPAHQTIQPAHQTIQPAHQTIQPAHQTIQPAHQTIQPAHQTIRPAHLTVHPAHQTIQPAHQTIQPTHQTIQPTRQTIQPARQTMQNVHNQHVTKQQQTSRPSVIQTIQVDGPNDSDSDDDDDDDDDDLNDPHDDNDDGEDKPQEDSEPLNSEDDVSDDDSSDLFDTDNVVVCQFDRITRSKNKWKFHLKDGIMNLNGVDYVFTKATGEAEW